MTKPTVAHVMRRCFICGNALITYRVGETFTVKDCPDHGYFHVSYAADNTVYVTLHPHISLDELITRSMTTTGGSPSKPVRCHQNGVRYDSILAASKALHISRTSLRKHLKGYQKSVKGYTFTEEGINGDV